MTRRWQFRCPGPHPQCRGCGGQRVDVRETFYLGNNGEAEGVVAPHRCWHCKGRGYTCQSTTACAPPHG
ncbi:hypothetical protein [Streptomyces triticirhizae]|uniref:hypothetical protein n=1 Tax=Streptomyces triticirhizae TaxID=2483353 RepID=UPI0011C45975|nr:hypothetical protein [Streptomyces triticirhizae]